MSLLPSDAVIVTTPIHESLPAPSEWWRDAVIYQIYPRSFADSDGDGIGDLPGITARLDHVAALGADAVWLSPFFPSPQADGGYDVSDYCAVDPLFGTLADFDTLLARAHDLGLRVIVDLVPNHTSDEHPWFRDALAAGPGSPERDRYHFRTGRGARGENPPTNWQSIFGGPAWTRVAEITGRAEDADQWYLHMFDRRQPDLNWACPEIPRAFEEILRFWLDRGVDGFRIDVAHGMVKHPDFPDWDGPAAMIMGGGQEVPARGHLVDVGPMFDQDGVHDIYRAWHRVLDAYPGDRMLVAEACVSPPDRAARYVRADEMQQAFNFDFMQARWNAPELRAVITDSLRASDAVGAPTTWVLSNHDTVRHASLFGLADTGRSPNGIGFGDEQPDAELGLRRARAAILLTLALPGSTYLYQGEELGLPEHTALDDALRQDPAWFRSGHTQRGRDGCRVPLPWTAHAPAFGFGPTERTWLPQPADWARLAVDSQDGVPGSTLELYRAAIRLRRAHALGSGGLAWVDGLPGQTTDVLAFRNGRVLIIVNLGARAVAMPASGTAILTSDAVAAREGVVATDHAAWILLPEGLNLATPARRWAANW